MDMPKRKTFVVAVETSNPDLVAQKLRDLGEALPLLPSLYVVVTKHPEGEIILALDPLKIRSIKGLAVIQTSNMVWTSLGSERDGAIRALLKKGGK
jgi:hypothetical protein